MTVITKSFGHLPASAISGGGVKSQITWEQMLPYLKQAFHISPNEVLEGISVDAHGIKAHINYKKIKVSNG